MATYNWQVPVLEYANICELLWAAHQASVRRDKEKLASLTERLRTLGCPKAADPLNDTIVVTPKGARIIISRPGLPT